MDKKISAIVQARMSSTRLPGKVLLLLEGKPVLWHIVNRLKYCKNIDKIVIATSTNPNDDAIAEFAKKEGIPFTRGSESDLINRFNLACKEHNIDIFARVTGDCPFVDPELLDNMVQFYFENKSCCELLSNVHPPTFPDGLDLEIIPFKIIAELDQQLTDPFERECFTAYLFNKSKYKIMNYANPINLSEMRWTLDTPEDYEFFKIIFGELYPKKNIFVKEDILSLIQEHPDLSKINNKYARNYSYYVDLEKELVHKKVLVVGCGSIGMRHVQNLKTFFKGKIVICDTLASLRDQAKEKYPDLICYADFEQALTCEKPDFTIISTPNHTHIPLAAKALNSVQALKYSSNLLIEKPLAHEIVGIDELLRQAKQNKVLIKVGFNARFNRLIQDLKKMVLQHKIGQIYTIKINFGSYLPDRHPGKDYRLDYAAKKAMGGGVILDVIHELDYLLWIFGKPQEVACFASKRSSLEIDTEDSADILFKFELGFVANLHLDFLKRPYCRVIEIIGEKGTIVADLAKDGDTAQGEIKVFDASAKSWELTEYSFDPNETYVRELKNFLLLEENDYCSGESAKEALILALTAKESAESGQILKINW